jgi:ankyrin repeat protein
MVLQEGPQIYTNNIDHINSIFATLVQRHIIIIEILLSYGADIYSQDSYLGNAL